MTGAHSDDQANLQSNTSSPVSFTRRGLLAAGLGSGAVGLLGLGGTAWAVIGDEPAAPGRLTLSEGEANFIDALTDALFPPGNALGVAGRDVDVTNTVDQWVAVMPPTERRIVGSLFHLLQNWPRLSFSSFSRFSDLSLEQRVSMLEAFDSSALEARRGIGQLLRALISVIFFEDERVQVGMGMEWGCEVPL